MSNNGVRNDIKDFFIEVSQGNIAGHSFVHKFGGNNNIPDNTWELISVLGGTTSFRSSPSTVRIKSGGDIEDNIAGSGARSIVVIGVDDTLLEATEIIVTSGTSASLETTTSFWRLYRAYVNEVGDYGGTNLGGITIEDSGGVADMIKISNGLGQTQYAAYTIPSNKTGYLLGVHLTVDSNVKADFRLMARENMNNVVSEIASNRLKFYWGSVSGVVNYLPKSPELILNGNTDIWLEARGNGGTTQVSANFEILLVDNPIPDIKTI